MIGIYKITNKVNGKIYIGQSIHIEKRWQEHCQPSNNKSLIAKAIKKYGKENFLFEVVEQCIEEELLKKEEYYIKLYNSVVPNGYNQEMFSKSKSIIFFDYDKDTFLNIVEDIQNTDISFKEIASKYNLDVSMIYYINRGDYHSLEEFTYPLREVKDFSKKYYYCVDCGKEISKGATRCLTCLKKKYQKVERPNREKLKQLIRTIPFTRIGEMYGVSDNAIRKWCISEKLPKTKKEIKAYSDKEWEKI